MATIDRDAVINNPFYSLEMKQQMLAAADKEAMNGVMPTRPDFNNWIDSNGHLQSMYSLGPTQALPSYDQVTMDPTALNQIKEQAFNKDASAWAQLQNNQQRMDEQNKIDQLTKQTSSANAQGLAQLMSSGGAGSGSRERLAASNAKNAMFNRNALTRGGMSDRLNIGLADQGQKADLLKAIPGFEGQVADLKLKNNAFDADNQKFNIQMNTDRDKFNLTNALKGLEAQNNYNSNVYSEQMKAWAANKQADATANSGK
jgi:hypothetical protein